MPIRPIICGVVLAALATASSGYTIWGFYAHREINRLAVYTVPAPLAKFYKLYSSYISTHAVDPDKRRYAAALEGQRHFIDMERFAEGRVERLPRTFGQFHAQYTTLWCVGLGDSTVVRHHADSLYVGGERYVLPKGAYEYWYRSNVKRAHGWELDTLHVALPVDAPGCRYLRVVDTMTRHGILPYNLIAMQQRLTAAFRQNDTRRVIQLSAEIGHYIGDATVPLHTTENYNGQLTGQRGIHSFWESRLPELFAAAEYDVLVGRARYLQDPAAFYFQLIAESHSHVDSVLLIEADLRRRVPEDRQMCYEERLGAVTRVPCASFARLYSDRLDGMVEARFRTAIRAVGSAWYTAWVDAGEPNMELGLVDAAFLTTDSVYRHVPGLDGQGH